MKTIFAILSLSLSMNSFAGGWKEKVTCNVSRGNVDMGTVSKSVMSGTLVMDGPHNGEFGSLKLKSPMLPSYTIVFEKLSSGRTDESSLTTSLGSKVVAKSSVDTQQSAKVDNKFVTEMMDFEITISCSSVILGNN